MAAVLARGEGALLSGRAAGYLYGLVRGTPPRPEVTAPRRRRVTGVRTRQSRAIGEREASVCRGIPVTSVARTLVDLARDLSDYELGRACHEAGIRYGTTPRNVESVLARRPISPGAANLRRIAAGDEPIVLSRLEERFLSLLRENALPLPTTNRPAGGRRVDCRWAELALTVELDSYKFHRSRHAWEADRRREREAHARGADFRRYTYGDVYEDSRLMLAELRQLLRRRRNQ